MKGKSVSTAAAALTLLLMRPIPLLAVDCCYVDDPSQTTCLGSPIQSNEELPGQVCGHTITGSNCVLQIKADVAGTSSACLTIGPGVTMDMENHVFTCSAYSACGVAVTIPNSGAAGAKVVVKNGQFHGCWLWAVRHTGGSNDTVQDVTIDGASIGSCTTQGWVGVDGVTTISRVLVVNTLVGVWLRASGDKLADSILHTNGTALTVGATTGQTIDNVLMIDNGIAVSKDNTSYLTTIKSSVIRDSTTCNCQRASVCDDTCSQSQFLSYSTPPTFVEDSIR